MIGLRFLFLSRVPHTPEFTVHLVRHYLNPQNGYFYDCDEFDELKYDAVTLNDIAPLRDLMENAVPMTVSYADDEEDVDILDVVEH